jgi:hypothetical protein
MSGKRGVPKVLWAASIIMYLQAVTSMYVAAVQLGEVIRHVRAGDELSGLTYVAFVLDPVVAVLLAVAATMLITSQRPGIPVFAAVLEVIGIVEAAINLFSGRLQPILAIIIALVVIGLLFAPRLRHPVS